MIADLDLATQINEYDKIKFAINNCISPKMPHGLSKDLWSLGVMMYTMLTGNPPPTFAQNSEPIEAKWVMPPNLSYYAQDLLNKLLNKDPLQRISLVQVYQHPFLNNALNNEYQPHVGAHIGSSISSSSLTFCRSYTPRMPPILLSPT